MQSPEQELMVMYAEKFRELAHREIAVPSVPSILHNELKYNLFMQCRAKWFQDFMKVNDPVLMMHILREWKNDKKKPGTHIFSQQYLSHSIGI